MDAYVLKVGKKFETYQDVKTFIESYETTNKQKFWVRSSTTVKSAKVKRPLNERIVCYDVHYACIHGGAQFQSSGKGLRKTKSYRMDCPAHIKFLASTDGNYLQIKSFNDNHWHSNMTEEMCDILPHLKKLTDLEKSKIEEYLSVEGKTKFVQAKIHRQYADGTIKSESTDLLNAVKLLTEDHQADVCVLQDGDNNFKGLYFSTENMKILMKSYPQIVTLDGTYKLVNDDLTVMLLIVVNAEGSSEVVGVGLLRQKNFQVFKWFLQIFKSQNEEAVQEIKCFMGDKDYLKRKAVKELFPGIPIYICRFQTLKNFKRNITERTNLSREQKEVSLKLFLQLVYSNTSEKYNENYKSLCDTLPFPVVEYFNKNWHLIKRDWVLCYMNSGNLQHYTSNRFESVNNKIENTVPKVSSLNHFIEYFFKWLQSHESERNCKVSQLLQKPRVTDFHLGSSEIQYQNFLTRFAFDYVLHQIELSKLVNVINTGQRGYEIESSKGKVMVSIDNCQCGDFSSMLLPCKHILAIRELEGLPLFNKQFCHKRWRRSYFIRNCRALNCFGAMITNNTVRNNVKTVETLSVDEKRKKGSVVVESLLDLLAESSDSDFQYRLEALEKIGETWRCGREINISQAYDTVACNDVKVEYTNSDEELSNSEELADIILPAPVKRKKISISEEAALEKKPKIKIPLTYNSKSLEEKQKQLLNALVLNEEIVQFALSDEYIIGNNDLRNEDNISNILIDERVSIDIINEFMEDDTFEAVKTIVKNKKDNPKWICSQCAEELSEPEYMFCESCLTRFHLKCLGLEAVPENKYFFCRHCY